MTMRKQRPDESPDEYLCYQGEQSFARGERRRRQHEATQQDFLATLRAGGMPDPYPPEARLLNTFALHPFMEKRFDRLRYRVLDYADRVLLTKVGAAELHVWRGIVARTFGYRKLAERVTVEELEHGIRDDDGSLTLNEDGLPRFVGCGMCRSAIKTALHGLLAKGVLSRLDTRQQSVPRVAYVPVPVTFALTTLVADMMAEAKSLMAPSERAAVMRSLAEAGTGFSSADDWENGALSILVNLPAWEEAVEECWSAADEDLRQRVLQSPPEQVRRAA